MARMKRWVIGLTGVLLLALPMSASAIELTDYMDPDLFYQDAELLAMFTMRDGNQDQTSYNGSAEVFYDMEYSTLPFKWQVFVEGNADFDRGANEDDDSNENYWMEGWTEAKKYINEIDGPFYFGRFDAGYRSLEGNNDDDPYAEVTAGAGYGRVITATPLMEAVRVVEDLQEYGIITGAISDAAYLKLADVIAKEQEYKSKYSLREYEKYWYEDMEKVLRDEGVLTNDTLGAMGVIRIQDILTDEGVLQRKHGWEAKLGIGYLISDYSGNDSDPVLRGSFEYAKPYGFKWQLIEQFSYATILEDWEFGDTDHNINNRVSLTYEMTEMIDWINVWDLDIILPSDSDEDESYRNALWTELRYYLTNTVDLVTRLQFDHFDHGDNEDDDVATTFFVGVAYTIF